MRSSNIAYIPRLDHLRLLAALLVLGFHFFHYNAGGWRPLPELAWMGLVTEGHTGVSLFFVLSGFIFMTIALAGGEIRYREFMRNRLLRIAPLFLVIFVVAISIGRDRFVATDLFYIFATNLGDAPTSWHFATGPAWSISVEFTFYLVFPFLALFCRRYGAGYLVKLLLLMLVVKVAAFFASSNSTHMFYSTLIGRFDQFLLGMLAAVVYTQRREWLAQHGIAVLVAGIAGIAIAISAQAKWASFFLSDTKQVAWIYWNFIEATVWAIVLVGYLSANFSLPRVVDNAFRKGGEWSFSIYMWHAVVIFSTHEILGVGYGEAAGSLLIAAAVVLVATTVVAWLSYNVIELPFLQLRHTYTSPGSRAVDVRDGMLVERGKGSSDDTKTPYGAE